MSHNHNGNHLPDDDHLTPAEAGTEHAKSRFARIGRTLVGVVPILAIANLAYAMIRIGAAPKSWQTPVTETAETILRFNIEPISCLAMSIATLAYWSMRDGRLLLLRITMSGIKTWWRKQKSAAWAEFLAEEKSKERAKGRTEGDASGYARAYAEMGHQPPEPPNGGPPPQSGSQAS